jgi:predicted secreted protein
MTLVSGIVVFFCAWWIIFFMVLPFGVQPPEEQTVGHDRGAPQQHRILLKILITTLITSLVWGGVEAIIRADIISFRN